MFKLFILKLKLIWFILKLDYWTYLKTYLSQRQKGYLKYGKHIESCKKNDYDWKKMATEELVDAIEYIKMIG